MRILRLADKVDPSSEAYHQYTLPQLDWHDVTLCTFYSVTMPVDNRVDLLAGDGRLRGYLQRLWDLLCTRDFDVVHVHSLRLALPLLVLASVVRPSLLVRSILHVHTSYDCLGVPIRWVLLPALLLFSRVICCGLASYYSLPRLYRWLAGRRLMTIRDGVDLRRVDRNWVPQALGVIDRSDDLQLVSVGPLRTLKNQETLLRALARAGAKDVQLTIIGDGPDRDKLEALCRELRIADRVRFTGQLSRDQALRTLWRADAMVSMSREEGLPVAVLEAMACHCPVILSDIPPHREIRSQRLDLIPLLETNDCRGLAEAIDDWASMPLDVLRAWGADCRQHVEWDWALDRTLEQFELVLTEFDRVVTPEWNAFCRSVQITHQRRRAA